mmetsp:Transcript_1657/g.2462  ORF Transcript_1657/g.2462 Transcript_1657/m.2462 type:complete len:137 (-) Transcript_1657:114-524(-)
METKSTSSAAPTEGGDTFRIRFIFANRDGIHAEIECSPSDNIETVTKALQSKWPSEINETAPDCDRIRLICMGKGVLGPSRKTLEECEVPVFLTHPTPVNVSVKPITANQSKISSIDRINDRYIDPPPTECCCTMM